MTTIIDRSFLVLPPWIVAFCLGLPVILSTSTATAADEPFRPEPGKFPPLERAHSYRGELVFVDHANRRGSLRVQGEGTYFRNAPHPFAMLPYGIVRYHGAPADLRDIPVGTVLHVRGFLPPDPQTSAVPVLPVDSRKKNSGYSGAGIYPAENHVLLLEDEPSYCLREGVVWKLKEMQIKDNAGMIDARRESSSGVVDLARNPHARNSGEFHYKNGEGGDREASDESMTFDAATRIWRGRECLAAEDLIAEGIWPAEGKKSLDGQSVLLGITWKPTPDGIFTRFHISDIWLDDTAMQRAARNQTETHKAYIRSRWMPARIDTVEYGKFGRATVTATLFGGMDESLYADFKNNASAMMNGVENTLKHNGGNYGPAHMASAGRSLRSHRQTERRRWAAAASRYVLRPTSSSKAFAPAESSVFVPPTGRRSTSPAKNSSATAATRKTASPHRISSRNTDRWGSCITRHEQNMDRRTSGND
ncbi:MAG: hypothetical protein R3C59_27035 [Planctomycetaceae bacterium]